MENEVSKSIELIDWGAASRAMENQAESGDRYWIQPLPRGVLVVVLDALGHGQEAATAARAAIAAIRSFTHGSIFSLIALVQHCHQVLARTRGVVMTMVWINDSDETITWLGVGNVEGVLVRASPAAEPNCERVLLRGGVVGDRLPPLRASVVPVARLDTLILATDGIRSDFVDGLFPHDPPQQMADRILARYGKESDDALVLVVRYLGRSP